MRIVCERSGGFAGLTTRAEVDTAHLSPADARKLKQMVEESRLLEQPARAADLMPDQYQYDLTIEDGGRTHTVQTNDAAASEETMKLVDWVMQTARKAQK